MTVMSNSKHLKPWSTSWCRKFENIKTLTGACLYMPLLNDRCKSHLCIFIFRFLYPIFSMNIVLFPGPHFLSRKYYLIYYDFFYWLILLQFRFVLEIIIKYSIHEIMKVKQFELGPKARPGTWRMTSVPRILFKTKSVLFVL